jgi:hypothetical protein
LDVVFTISETPIFASAVPPLADVPVEPPPQAVRLSAPKVRTAAADKRRVVVERGSVELNIESPGV